MIPLSALFLPAAVAGETVDTILKKAGLELPLADIGREPSGTQPSLTPGQVVEQAVLLGGPGKAAQAIRRTREAQALTTEAKRLTRALPPGRVIAQARAGRLGERGGVSPSTITGATIGAATGAVVGESPEEKAGLALGGALLGAFGSRRLFRGLPPTMLKITKPDLPNLPASRPVVEAVRSAVPESPPPLSPQMTQPVLNLPIHRRVVTMAEDVLKAGGEVRDPHRLLSDQITDMLGSGKITDQALDATLRQHGLGFIELAELFRPAIRNAAQRLGTLGAMARRLEHLATTPEAKAELAALREAAGELDEGARLSAWWRRLDNVRRGLLVTQLSTAMRNAETQGGRVGLDIFQQALDAGIQRMFRLGDPLQRTHPLDGWAVALNLFRRGTKADVETILKIFPKEQDRLFLTYSSDIARRTGQIGTAADKVFNKAEAAVNLLNVFNRGQEYLFRRAVFMGKLDQRLRGKGLDLERIIEQNDIGRIGLEDIRGAVTDALAFTFAEQPAFGTIGQKFVNFVTSFPGATFVLPFPRFLVNSLKFNFEFSPLGLLKLLSKEQRAAFAAGNTQVMSRAILGSAMLGTAWQIRNSEFAGERWYELRLPDGKILDTRPFNPFSAYLFAADLIKRKTDGTLNTLSTKDLAMGVLSSNLRAGTGLFTLDKVLQGLTDLGDPQEALRVVQQFAGDVLGGVLTPLGTLKDMVAEFDAGMRTLRSTREEPLLGPAKSRIPGVAETLPERFVPTREGPIQQVSPALKQATGLLLRDPKNPLEQELDRLGFERFEILPSTGDPKADNLLVQQMGKLAERRLVPLVESVGYRRLSDTQKGERLRLLLQPIRRAAAVAAAREEPALFRRLRFERLPRRRRAALEEIGLTPRRVTEESEESP